MLKAKKIFCKLLAMVMVICSIPTIGTQDVAAAKKVTAQFIDVTRWENCGEIGKGDATLINFKGQYFLVDTGRGLDYGNNGDPLTENMKTLAAKGIKLTGIIITHPHNDHMGALEKMIALNSKKKFSVLSRNATTLYYNAAFGTSKTLNVVKNGPFKKLVAIEPYSIWDVTQNGGEAITKKEAKSKNGIYVYGTTLGKIGNGTSMSADSMSENIHSMLVQIKTADLKGLILGDLYKEGLTSMVNEYKFILNTTYDFCTIGHHGLRSKNKFSWSCDYNTGKYPFVMEYEDFYGPISCKAFVYTAREDKLTNKTYSDIWGTLNHHLVVYKGSVTYLSNSQPSF